MKIWPWIIGAVGVGAGAWWFVKRNAAAEGWTVEASYPEGVIPGVTPGYPIAPSVDELLPDTEGGAQMGESYVSTSTGSSSYTPASTNTASSPATADALGTGTSTSTAATPGTPTTPVAVPANPRDVKLFAANDPQSEAQWQTAVAAANTNKSGGLTTPSTSGAPTVDPAKAAAAVKAQYGKDFQSFYDQAIAAYKAGKPAMRCPGNVGGACAKAQSQAAKDFMMNNKKPATASAWAPAAAAAPASSATSSQSAAQAAAQKKARDKAQAAFNAAVKKAQDAAAKKELERQKQAEAVQLEKRTKQASVDVAAANKKAADAQRKKQQEAQKRQQEAQKKALAQAAAMLKAAANRAANQPKNTKQTKPVKNFPVVRVVKPNIRGLTEAEYRASASRSAVEAQRREWAANELAERIAALTYERN